MTQQPTVDDASPAQLQPSVLLQPTARFRPGSRAATQWALQCVRQMYQQRDWKAFSFQKSTWRSYVDGHSGLVHSATGTGKTLAIWMGVLADWMRHHPDPSKWNPKRPPPATVLWLTPLRALAGDTLQSLQMPIDALGLPWTLDRRTSDVSSSRKAKQLKRLPTALVTTPESLSLMLTHTRLIESLAGLRCVVVDEWHELLGTKRGVQTELGLARLRRINPTLQTWGVSATLGNLDQALQSLMGVGNAQPQKTAPTAKIIQGYKKKKVRIGSVIPKKIERFPWSGHIGTRMVPAVTDEIENCDSSLIFANTRSQTELWYQQLLQQRPDWAGALALHHGSLDRSVRNWVEHGLREGSLKSVVCTSSLDLGVDFTSVDLVFQIGSPKGAARLLQRAGRSGHQPDAESRLLFVPTHALELVELAAAQDAIESEHLESRPLIESPLDVLAQHVVTIAIGGGFQSEELLREVRSTVAYHQLTDQQWAWVLNFVVHGGTALDAYPEFKRVQEQRDDENGVRYVVQQKKTITLHRMNIGTIVSDAAMRVKYQSGATLGTVEENFISRVQPGEKFLFGGRLVQLLRIRDNVAFVKRATGTPDTVPRWMGGRMPLSSELSSAMRWRLQEAGEGVFRGREMRCLRPLLELQKRWSCLPTMDQFLIERIKTRDGHQMFFYPFEGRLAHEGLAALLSFRLSKRNPVTYSIACNDYGFVLQSKDATPLQEAIDEGLFDSETLEPDILESMNATEMAKRQFRQIAHVAGLIHPGYPGRSQSSKNLQASSNLFFDVFQQYDPGNLLLLQAKREVLQQQLEFDRMLAGLDRIASSQVVIKEPPKVTPLSFPLLVDRLRERVSSETIASRIQKLQQQLEKEAEKSARQRERKSGEQATK